MQSKTEKVLIVGSGVGGLSTGIILAKLGYNVTILEKNRQAGGLMRSYTRDGISCETGVHYLGSLAKGQILDTFFEYMGVKENIPVSRMGVGGVIDRYQFNTKETHPPQFDLPEGFDAFEANLHDAFPGDTSCIQTVVSHIRNTSKQLHSLELLFGKDSDFSLLDQTEAYGEILDQLGCSPGLRSVLAMASSWIGVGVEDCPAYYHNMALASYLSSSWRLDISGAGMADVFVKRFQDLGGTLRTTAEINKICVQNRIVEGVELVDGERLDADIVIGAIHPQMVLKMLPDGAVKPSYRNRIQKLQNTHSVLSVHASVDAGLHPEIPYNMFSVDTDQVGNIKDLRFFQIRKSGQPGKSLLSILTSGHDEAWKPWTESMTGKRGHDYKSQKREHAEQLLDEASNIFGRFSDLKLLDVATPLSIRDWMNSPDGSAYGVLRSSSQTLATAMLNRTAVKGLSLAGQNVLAPGIIGTIMGSFSTVKLLIGPEEFINRIRL